jgi:hypothetical protein
MIIMMFGRGASGRGGDGGGGGGGVGNGGEGCATPLVQRFDVARDPASPLFKRHAAGASAKFRVKCVQLLVALHFEQQLATLLEFSVFSV